MYTFEWKPKNQETSKFEGTVLVKVPDHIERMNFVKNLNTTVDQSGQLVEAKGIDLSVKLIAYATQYVDKVSLKRKDDGYQVPDVKWLSYDIDGAEILGEIGWCLFEGIKLGKN